MAFLTDIDESLVEEAAGQSLKLCHIGRSALVWKYDYAATTEDIDVIRPESGQRLLDLALVRFGRGTPKAKEYNLYLEEVNSAFPPMPSGYMKRAVRVEGLWWVIELYHLDPHDLAASKLRRFATKDREDIRHLCDLNELDPDRLKEILEKAFPFNLEKDGDEYRDTTFEHLRIVQAYLRGERYEF